MRAGLLSHATKGRVAVALAGVAVAVATLGGAAPGSAAPSSGIVINEVYGGGGNSGATYTNDFIELTNRSNAAVSVDGWSVQYHSAGASGAWQVTPLSGTIAPGARYLPRHRAPAARNRSRRRRPPAPFQWPARPERSPSSTPPRR